MRTVVVSTETHNNILRYTLTYKQDGEIIGNSTGHELRSIDVWIYRWCTGTMNPDKILTIPFDR